MKTLEEIWQIGLHHRIQQKKSEFFPFLEFLIKENVKSVMEIGMYSGGSTSCFANIANFVIGITHPNEASFVPIEKLKSYCTFIPIMGDTHLLDTYETVKNTLNGTLVDLLFIDGDHGAVGVQQDFDLYSQFVKKGGLVAFHDIADSAQHRSVGVNLVDVYNELIKTYKHIEFMEPNGVDCGIGVIWL